MIGYTVWAQLSGFIEKKMHLNVEHHQVNTFMGQTNAQTF